MPPDFIPSYNKPDAPGVWMNFDNTVSVYHAVAAADAFEAAAEALFAVLREAQERFPGWPRVLYLDIEGHRDAHGRFEPDFVEYQQEFLFGVIAPFTTALEAPLTGPLLNPNPQRNDLPDRLRIGEPLAAAPRP